MYIGDRSSGESDDDEEKEVHADEVSEDDIMQLMGFSGFDSTKVSHAGNFKIYFIDIDFSRRNLLIRI